MKRIFSVLIFLIFAKQSLALECIACDTSNDEECELSYECPKGSKYCETLVSKVEGSYSVILSCSTKEKCDAIPVFKNGLDECNHDDDNTECYSCCKDDECNTLKAALKKLPEDILEDEKPAKKGKKLKEKSVDEEDEELDENEDEEVNEKQAEKKKTKGKDKKSKSKEKESVEETNPENIEENPDEVEEIETEEEEPNSEEKSIKKVDDILTSSNETTAEVANENPENKTVINQTSVDNKTVVATNLTEKDEGTENNNGNVQILEPIDPNSNKLNETLEVVQDLGDNLDNAGNAENMGVAENTDINLEDAEPKAFDENSANNVNNMEESEVQGGVEYNAPQNPEDEIPTENSEGGEQHELFEPTSSSTKYQISKILLSAIFILVSIQLF